MIVIKEFRRISWDSLFKGTVSRDFCFWFFSWISFPQALEYTIRAVSNFFENSRRYSQLKVDHRPMTPVANFTTSFSSVVDTGGKFATDVSDTGGKQWDSYQAEDTLKWIWRQKFIYMLTLLSKGVPTKLLKFFWLKSFFICQRCQRHRWSTLSCEYLREFWKKFEMVLMGYFGAGGKTDS